MRYLKELEFKDLNDKPYFLKNSLAAIKTVEEMAGMGLYRAFDAMKKTEIGVYRQLQIIQKLTGITENDLEALVLAKGTNELQVRLLGLISLMLGGEEAIKKIEAEEDAAAAKEAAEAGKQ